VHATRRSEVGRSPATLSGGDSKNPVVMLGVVTLVDEKYMLFTTFRRDGRAVSTPVWLVHLPEGEIGFSTGSDSGKAKRLRHTPRVTLQACDRTGGNAHGPVLDGRARLVSGAELQQIQTATKAKYGAMATAIGVAASVARRLGSKRAGADRVGVIISLHADAAANI
jgi:PPOX class probable F420-dependent enzyme